MQKTSLTKNEVDEQQYLVFLVQGLRHAYQGSRTFTGTRMNKH